MQPTLYILMRNDMASMNPGKAMAQAAHAGNDFMISANDNTTQNEVTEATEDLGFLKTIVLAVNEDDINSVVAEFATYTTKIHRGVIVDPTYPIKDGKVTHYISLTTCMWVFAPGDLNPAKDKLVKDIIGMFPLHK